MMIKAWFCRHGLIPLVLSFLLGFITTTAEAFAIPSTLITFDVDGTLVKGSGTAARDGAHAQAFGYAISQLLGDGQPVVNVADALPRRLYHGSTDGLILLRYAQAALKVPPSHAGAQLDTLMQFMYEYIMTLDDDAVANLLTPLPRVIETLEALAILQQPQEPQQDHHSILCGLVTGNVEGIARRKMKAVGIWQTGALHPPCKTQPHWLGTQDIGFLGGFGSDYCSKDIENLDRNHLDRAEQIKIATRRCQTVLMDRNSDGRGRVLKRVVHVGDAPADVLAAKAVADSHPEYCVGMVAVATGSYSAEELHDLCGTPVRGQWEPVVLKEGMKDPIAFLQACGIEYS
jgi:phosphoglycolate phosphatase-like HAD superfamily hydrolase